MPHLPRRARRRGVSAVELAILLPFLCFLFVVSVDYSRIFYFSITVTNCARNGALYGSGDAVRAGDTTGITAAARADATSLDPQLLTVASATDAPAAPTYVEVTVTYPFRTITSYPGVPGAVTLSRTVRMAVVPLTPAGT